MADRAILAIDQGTTNTKALLFSESGDIVARASVAMEVQHPQVGWAEQLPDAIWRAVQAAIAEVTRAGDWNIEAVGISNQRESILLWDPIDGAALSPCVLWQCRRTSDLCARLREEGREAEVRAATGLSLDPLFSGPKLGWLLERLPDAEKRIAEGRLAAGTVDSWVLWNLTGQHRTDLSNASRTQLLNLASGEWDPRLARLFNVPLDVLPAICSSDTLFGWTLEGRSALSGGIPIYAIMGDSHAALYGHGIDAPGRAKVTIGTGSSLMTPTAEPVLSAHGLSSTIAWGEASEIVHALEGNISVSGAAASFAAQLIGVSGPGELTALAAQVPDSGGVQFVPALAGLGAPHWIDQARGIICGMSLATRREHIARAALEAIALQIRDVFQALESDLEHELTELVADGGAVSNDLLLQMMADALDRPVRRTTQAEVSARGVARMAGRAAGIDILPAEPDKTFVPLKGREWREATISAWEAAVARASAAF